MFYSFETDVDLGEGFAGVSPVAFRAACASTERRYSAALLLCLSAASFLAVGSSV
jgi:hypothetical protein